MTTSANSAKTVTGQGNGLGREEHLSGWCRSELAPNWPVKCTVDNFNGGIQWKIQDFPEGGVNS